MHLDKYEKVQIKLTFFSMSGSKPGQSFEPFYPSAIKKACGVLSTRRTAKQVARFVAVWASRWTGNMGVWADGHH